jgi:hypothetical protein
MRLAFAADFFALPPLALGCFASLGSAGAAGDSSTIQGTPVTTLAGNAVIVACRGKKVIEG